MPVPADKSLGELEDDASRRAGIELIQAIECFQRAVDPQQAAFAEPGMLHLLACWKFALVAAGCRAAVAKGAEVRGATEDATRVM